LGIAMANLSKTKHLFGFTSPRTLEKIIPEIQLLTENFTGENWSGDDGVQLKFFDLLYKSGYYEGETYPTDPALAARDRITRAPKALGFVNLNPTISITDAGKELITTNRPHDIITKQLFKFQLPSPFHTSSSQTDFFIKPYLELLRLINDLGSLSKTEIALFFLQLTHLNKYEIIVKKITQFRERAKDFEGSRKTYVSKCFEDEISEIFKNEITSEEFKTRESDEVSLKKFVQTKRSNMLDYADAFARYIRATQLITFERKTFRLIIAPYKKAEVDFILHKIDRNPIAFKNEKEFKLYLFSATNIQLLLDNESILIEKLDKLGIQVYSGQYSINGLKDLLESREELILKEKIEETSKELKTFKDYDEIIEVFLSIQRKEVPDPPLFLEWNVWRALVMLNYAKMIQNNFILDLDGMPLNYAPGKKPDIELDYGDFGVIVEVTLSTGQKQYEMEGEPVARHFGRAREELHDNLYCIFIANQISEGTLSHYFNLNKMNTRYYGGKTKIIPLTIDSFIAFIEVGKNLKFNNPKKLEQWLEKLWIINQDCKDENIWFKEIQDSITRWAS
jgi:hypothetical protein